MSATTDTAAALVAEAQRRTRALGPTEFAAEVDRGEAVLIDVREADERVRDGSIHGAVHIPRGMLEFRADPSNGYADERLQPWRRVLLYSSSGGRSALAADTLAAIGYSDIAHLEGGIRAWSAAGLPLFGRQPPY